MIDIDRGKYIVSISGEYVSQAIRFIGIPKWRSLVCVEKTGKDETNDFASLLFEDEFYQVRFSNKLLHKGIWCTRQKADADDKCLYNSNDWKKIAERA